MYVRMYVCMYVCMVDYGVWYIVKQKDPSKYQGFWNTFGLWPSRQNAGSSCLRGLWGPCCQGLRPEFEAPTLDAWVPLLRGPFPRGPLGAIWMCL